MSAATSATAAVVENRMEPITKQESTTQIVVTGQGLWDVFMTASDSDKTRMGYVRSLVDKADALQIKGACDNMVERAIKLDYPEGKPKKAERRTKEQQARNVASIIKSAWGALSFARDALNDAGYDESTGWNNIRVIAPAALKQVGKTWDGVVVPTESDREHAKLLRQQKAQTAAMLDATKNTPRLLNESYESWQQRIAVVARGKVEDAAAEAVEKAAQGEFDKLVSKLDLSALGLLTSKLQDYLRASQEGANEISDAVATALLAAQSAGEVMIEEETD